MKNIQANHTFLLGVAASFAIIVFVLLKVFLPQKPYIKPLQTFVDPTPTIVLNKAQIGNTEITLEVARDPKTRAIGLSGRDSLPEMHGMVFLFDRENFYPPFWMKNTLIPLDFIWVDDGKVADLTENVNPSPSGTPDSDLPIYTSKVPTDVVIEVNAGFIEKYNITIGDTVTLEMQE